MLIENPRISAVNAALSLQHVVCTCTKGISLSIYIGAIDMQNDNALDTNLSSFRHSKMADIALFSFFVLCLIPITYRTLSVNYLFMLYPIWRPFVDFHAQVSRFSTEK